MVLMSTNHPKQAFYTYKANILQQCPRPAFCIWHRKRHLWPAVKSIYGLLSTSKVWWLADPISLYFVVC